MKPESLNNLINIIKSMPGIGKKQSEKIAYYLLIKNKDMAKEVVESINLALSVIKSCIICNNLTEEEVCLICSEKRSKKLMIVESPLEVYKFEEMGFNGKYHIIKNIFNANKAFNSEDLYLKKLSKRLKDFDEVILAISPTLEGEITSSFIASYLSGKIKISKLATGIPIGANVEYIDQTTLSQSFKNRKEVK